MPFGGPEFLVEAGGTVSGQIGLRPVFDIGRLGLRAMFPLAILAAIRRHQAKIMLGMLKISFGGYSIARRRRIPCEG